MYEPALFRIEDKGELIAFVRANPLGLVIVAGADGTSADLIPFIVDDDGVALRAHFARANPLSQTLASPQRVLVVFMGPQTYVTPGYYPSKAEHGRVVPTWNYAMVQAAGTARLRDESDWLAAQIADLTAQQEVDRPSPWAPSDAPEDFLAAQMRAIIGVEIVIEELRGKNKLSQNRNERDRRGVMAGLGGEAAPEAQAVAAMMRAKLQTDGPEADS